MLLGVQTMLFVKINDLKAGMRLARPIYNKNGALLYDRNTKLPIQGIYSIKNFGLIGLYILEPAEPLPPMTPEDIEFERFQTMAVFNIKDDFNTMLVRKKDPTNINKLVLNIQKQYGGLDHKINFFQNLRSKDDYIYKHSLNTAILCALMSHKLEMKRIDQSDLITAAIFHRIGEMNIPLNVKNKDTLDENDIKTINTCVNDGIETLRAAESIKTIIRDAFLDFPHSLSGRILKVAMDYDNMTAMNFMQEPMSEIAALNNLSDTKKYDKKVVEALIKSINILQPAVCVELTNHEKGVVITPNEDNVLRPVVLTFAKNEIYDLSNDSVFEKIQIKDLMKTMDNRVMIDKKTIAQYL